MSPNYDIKFGSLNVRGLNNNVKRQAIFTWARKKKFDVLLLQETYCAIELENKWKNEWGGTIVYANGSNHSKGVMIMLKPGLDYKIQRQKCDTNGRFIFLEIEMCEQTFILINVYAPNTECNKRCFFKDLLAVAKSLDITPTKQIIAAGDFNSIFQAVDKCGGKEGDGNVVKEMSTFIDEFDLVDIWRIRNPGCKCFTYRQRKPLIQSRLDYFLVSDYSQDIVVNTEIIPSVHSDHSAVCLYAKCLPEWPKGKGYWKFNSTFLEQPKFVSDMEYI